MPFVKMRLRRPVATALPHELFSFIFFSVFFKFSLVFPCGDDPSGGSYSQHSEASTEPPTAEHSSYK